MRKSKASALLLLGVLAIGLGGGRPPDAQAQHAQSAGEGAWQWPALPSGGGALRHPCSPNTQHLAAWKTSGPPTAKADEIGLHFGPRPGPKGADHVRVPCVGKLFFSLLPRHRTHSRSVVTALRGQYACVHGRAWHVWRGGGGGGGRRAGGGAVPAGGVCVCRVSPGGGCRRCGRSTKAKRWYHRQRWQEATRDL